VVVDWQKVASLLPIKTTAKGTVGTILEMRFRLGLKLADVCNHSDWDTGIALKGEQRRRRLEAVWKMIDRHMGDIKAILHPPASSVAKRPTGARAQMDSIKASAVETGAPHNATYLIGASPSLSHIINHVPIRPPLKIQPRK
jgi:hypothetical protein